MGRQFLTADDLVNRWAGKVARQTLANWRHLGRGPAFVKIGGRVLYPVDRVEAWEAENLHNANDN